MGLKQGCFYYYHKQRAEHYRQNGLTVFSLFITYFNQGGVV